MRITWFDIEAAIDLNLTRRLIRALPLGLDRTIIRILAFFFAPLSPTAWRIRFFGPLHINLSQMLALGYRRTVARMEKYLFFYKHGQIRDYSNLVVSVGDEYLAQARSTGRGILLVSIHTLYFRLLQNWLNDPVQDLRPYLIKDFPGKKGELKRVQKRYLHEQQNEIFAGRLIDVGPGIKEAVRVLRTGAMVLIAQDVFTSAAPVGFLGGKAPLNLGAIRLAAMTDSLILPVTAAQAGRKWLIRFWPSIDPRAGGIEEKLLSVLEEMVKDYPAVWQFWGWYWESLH